VKCSLHQKRSVTPEIAEKASVARPPRRNLRQSPDHLVSSTPSMPSASDFKEPLQNFFCLPLLYCVYCTNTTASGTVFQAVPYRTSGLWQHKHYYRTPRAGSGVVRIDPLHFLAGQCRTRHYLSMFYCIVYYGPFSCIVSFRCYVFCLLVILFELSLLAK